MVITSASFSALTSCTSPSSVCPSAYSTVPGIPVTVTASPARNPSPTPLHSSLQQFSSTCSQLSVLSW